jgi:hypothetical protein
MKKYFVLVLLCVLLAGSLVSCEKNPNKKNLPRLSNVDEGSINKKGDYDKKPKHGNEEGSKGSEANEQSAELFSITVDDIIHLETAREFEANKYELSFRNESTNKAITIQVEAAGDPYFVTGKGSPLGTIGDNIIYVYINASIDKLDRSIGFFVGDTERAAMSSKCILMRYLNNIVIGDRFRVYKNYPFNGVNRDYYFLKISS